MKRYRLNKNKDSNPNGNNEVHSQDCRFYNQLTSYVDLGLHSSCHSAVASAKALGYPNADGCKVCSDACNNG